MSRLVKILVPLLAVSLTILAAVKLLRGPFSVSQLVGLLRDFPPIILLELVGIATLMYVVRAFRFYLLLEDNAVKISFWKTLKVYVAGQALSPLPAGESARLLLIKLEANQSPQKVVTPMILLGVTEMIVAVLIAVGGSLFLSAFRLAASIALVGIIGLTWLLINHRAVALIIHKAPPNSKVKEAGKVIIEKQKEVHSAIFNYRSWLPSSLFIENLLLALLTDLLGGALIFLVGRYYHASLTFLWSFYVFAATTVLGELLPFIPGGIGVTEGGMTGILLVAGVSLSQALAVVIVFRAVTLVYGFLLGLGALLAFYSRKYTKYLARSSSKR